MEEFLSQHNIPFEDRNIREKQEYMEELQQLGHRSIPVTLIGDQVLTGFDPDALKKALSQANYKI